MKGQHPSARHARQVGKGRKTDALPSRRRDRRPGWLAIVFAAALAIRLIYVWEIRSAPFFSLLMGDSKSYNDAWARAIAAGDWIGKDVFYQAPLYPYFLGAIFTVAGHDLMIVRLCQAILGALACVFVADAGWRLFSRRAGLVAGTLLALYPAAIFFDGLLQKTVLDAFLISAAIWIISGIIVKGQASIRWLALGAAMGALSLSRENALALTVVVLVWSLVRRNQDSSTDMPTGVAPGTHGGSGPLAFVLGVALTLVPVATRNYLVGGGFYLTTSQFGTNLYLGNNPRTDGTAGSLIGGRGSPEYERQDAIDLAERAAGRALTPGQVSSYWTSRALAFVRAQPGAWLRLMGRKFVLLWNRAEAFDTESQESYAEWSPLLRVGGYVGHFGILVPIACFGLWVTWRDRSRLWILHALTASYAASVVVFFIYARYRHLLVPFLILFAAAGLAEAPAFLQSQTRTRLAAAAVVLSGLVVFTNWPVLSADTMRAVTEHNLGAALQSDGRLDAAIERYRRAIAIKPDYAPAYSNMGAALLAKGDAAAAIAAYDRALSAQPDFPDAHYNLANALLGQGDAKGAIEHFRRALAASPNSVEIRTNLGIALAEAGNAEEAVNAIGEALQLDPRSAVAHRVLGRVLADMNRSEAEPHLRQAVVLDPRDAEARLTLARWLVERGRVTESIPEFSAALEIVPDQADLHNDFGTALASLGKTDEATREFERALQLEPGLDAAQRNLAAVREARRIRH